MAQRLHAYIWFEHSLKDLAKNICQIAAWAPVEKNHDLPKLQAHSGQGGGGW